MAYNDPIIIESIGTYLPGRSVSTTEVLQGCKCGLSFPLENITGIKSRRMAAEDEYSIDLARKAVADCLSHSAYGPEDIDLLVCCNISRWDGPGMISFEPCSSLKLKRHFGFGQALTFDLANACAGMFTGIQVANAFIQSGAIRRGMVVSGEYITHLTKAAQREIESFMDARLACLTVGDAAAALILEKSPDPQAGFQKIDLQTYGRYSPYCVAKASPHGGFIMLTDSVNLTDAAIRTCAAHSINTLSLANWSPDSFKRLVMHQTSRMTLNSASREINRLLNERISHADNTVNNLEERGNTASTSHFIAIADEIRENRIQAGDRIVFSISASGLTVGTALYTFDDLPDRLRRSERPKKNGTGQKTTDVSFISASVPEGSRIRIESTGTLAPGFDVKRESLASLKQVATNCLGVSSYSCNDIGLLIYSGVYRSEYVLEPAFAALLAGELDMNAVPSANDARVTFAFDIFNGAVGFLNACFTAQQEIAAGNCSAAMVAASEYENNAGIPGADLMGVRETASAVILDASPTGATGFSRFLFRYDTGSQDAYTSYYQTGDEGSCLKVSRSEWLETSYLNLLLSAASELLESEGLDRQSIDLVFPPQISSGFIARLSEALAIPPEKFVNVAGEGPDLFSSSLPCAFDHARKKGLVREGDTGLLLSAGSGLQVACALYHF